MDMSSTSCRWIAGRIKVSGDALEILKEWRERLILDREALGERYVPSDAVFTNIKGGPILSDTVYNGLRKLCAKAGVPYLGTHACRHTFVSIHGVNGTPVEVVSVHVGHARPSFTLDRYRSVFLHERQDLTLDIGSLLDDVDARPPAVGERSDLAEDRLQDGEGEG